MKNIKVFVLATFLVLGFMISGCSNNNQLNSVGTATDGNEATIEKAAIRLDQASKEGGYKLIGAEKLHKWMEDGKKMIIIDTMPLKSRQERGQIPNSLNVELPKTSVADVSAEQKAGFLKALGTDKDATIIVYCGYTGCERSHVGAEIAVQAGYKNVYRLPGGIMSWRNAGFDYDQEK